MSYRPLYMLIFNDKLKRHNDAQPKFTLQPQNIIAEKPSVSYSSPSDRSITLGRDASSNAALKAPSSVTNKLSSTPSFKSYIKSSSATATTTTANQSDQSQVAGTSAATMKDHSIDRARETSHQPSRIRPTNDDPTRRSPAIPPSPQTRTVIAIDKAQLSNKPSPHRGKHVILKDSAPSVAQTPEAVVGNSNCLPFDNCTQTPSNKHLHYSLAKTIAEQTPNAFKVLGPGFNKNAPAEKSFNIQKSKSNSESNSLSSSNMPSDYEHIFHAPSQLADLPSISLNRSKRRETSSKKHRASHSNKRK